MSKQDNLAENNSNQDMISLLAEPQPLEINIKRTAVIIVDMQNAFVKEGKTLTITEHGKPIGRIIPEGHSIQERLQGLATTGILLQVGSSLPAIEPVTTSMGPKLVSDLVSEDRDVDYLP